MKQGLDHELQGKGPDPELDTLVQVLFDKVIPRLLRPLEKDGRRVKPSLVHGDLWYANSGLDAATGESLVFDACCLYAHNEVSYLAADVTEQNCMAHESALDKDEFGQWQPVCNRFGKQYSEAYHSHIQISPPEEDYNGRLDLYKL